MYAKYYRTSDNKLHQKRYVMFPNSCLYIPRLSEKNTSQIELLDAFFGNKKYKSEHKNRAKKHTG